MESSNQENKTMSPAAKGASLKQVLMERRKQLLLKERLEREEAERLAKEEEERQRGGRPGTGKVPSESGSKESARPLTGGGSRPRTGDPLHSRPGTGSVEANTVAAKPKELGEGEGAEAIVADLQLAEGRYDAIVPECGLTEEQIIRFQCLGVERDMIVQLRSLFTSLDKDGGGELSAAELYQALIQFGQNVTDDDVTAMMDEVDGDNSGAIDFLEFLLLAIPGMSKSNSSKKPRGFTVNPFRNAMFEDADGTGGEVGAREIEIPVQCFAAGQEDAVDEAKSKGLFAELRIRFKKNVHDNPGRSESARDGNIVLPLTLKRDCWVERVYPFNDKAPAQGSGGAGILFTAPEPPDPGRFPVPLSKLKCVAFPGGPVQEGDEKVEGFRIVSVTPKKLHISFDYKYGKYADFPPPPYDLTIIETGEGTMVSTMQTLVCLRSYLPLWSPLIFSSKVPKGQVGVEMSEVEIKEHLGELHTLQRQNLPVFVGMRGPESKVPALLEHEAQNLPWTADMESTDMGRPCMLLATFRLGGGSKMIEKSLMRELGGVELRLAAAFTEQVASASSGGNHGWLCCPPHPHVLPLVCFAGHNITLHPHVNGITGSHFGKYVLESGLRANQKRLVFLTIGIHAAWGLEHMHKHGIWHLDVKPDNLVVQVMGDIQDYDDSRYIRERVNVRLADFAHSACVSGANTTLRGTPPFWAPEQVHTPGAKISGGDVGGGVERGEYWGGQKCKDPPMPLEADMTDRTDSWGWSTTMLSMMGRLTEMKSLGHKGMINTLLEEGFAPRLDGIFMYEHEPYLEDLKEDMMHKEEAYGKVKAAVGKLEEDVMRLWMKTDAQWDEAVEAIKDVTPDDLVQVALYKRCPNLFRVVVDAAVAAALPDKKDGLEWASVKNLVSQAEFLELILAYDRTRPLSSNATKIVTKALNNPTFNPALWVEENVPVADAARPGQSYKVCVAFGRWVKAVGLFNETASAAKPFNQSLMQKEKNLAKLAPGLEQAKAKHAGYAAQLKGYKKNLRARFAEVVAIVMTSERVQAQQLVGSILGMDAAITNQQYFRLLRDCDYFLGEQSLLYRHLADELPPLEIAPDVQKIMESGTRKPFYSSADEGKDLDPDGLGILAEFPFLSGDEDNAGDSGAKGQQGDGILEQKLGGFESGIGALDAFGSMSVSDGGLSPIVDTSLPVFGSLDDGYESGRILPPLVASTALAPIAIPYSIASTTTLPSVPGTPSRASDSVTGMALGGSVAGIGAPSGQKLGSEPVIGGSREDAKPMGGRSLDTAPVLRERAQPSEELPPQHKRHCIVGKHFNRVRGVGDGLILAIAWGMKYQPGSRIPIGTLCAALHMMMPGQEWESACTVLGRKGSRKPELEFDEAANNGVDVAPAVVRALLGDKGRVEQVLLAERVGCAREAERRFLASRDAYLDAFGAAERLVGKEPGMPCIAGRIALSISRVWKKMRRYRASAHWCDVAEKYLHDAELQLVESGDESVAGAQAGFVFSGTTRFPNSRDVRGLRAREAIIQSKKLGYRIMHHRSELDVERWVGEDQKSVLKKASKGLFEVTWLVEKTMGSACDEIAESMFGMARVLEMQGKLGEARAEYERALDTRSKIWQYDSYSAPAEFAPMLEALARINTRTGKHVTATSQLQRAKSIYLSHTAPGEFSLGAARTCGSIGQLQWTQGMYKDAFETFIEGVDMCTGVIDSHSGHPERPHNHQGVTLAAADALMQRGGLLMRLGRYSEGASDYRAAASTYRESLTGPNHARDALEDHSSEYRADALIGLGTCLEEDGKGFEACEAFQQAYQLRFLEVGHEMHPRLAECSENLGRAFYRIGRHGIAMDWYKKALHVREHVQGKSHPDMIACLTNMAAIMRERGQLSYAMELTTRALLINLGVCGEINETTAQCLAHVAICKYPELSMEHNNLSERRKMRIDRQIEAEKMVVECERVLVVKQKELKQLQKQTMLKRIVMAAKEQEVKQAALNIRRAHMGVRMAAQECSDALARFDRVEDKMYECVRLLEVAAEVYKLAIPGSNGHWERQADQLVVNMRGDISAAKTAVENQVASRRASHGRASDGGSTTSKSNAGSTSTRSEQVMTDEEKKLKETREEIAELEEQRAMLILKLEGLVGGSQELLLSPRSTTRSRLVSQVSSEHSTTGLTSQAGWGLLRDSVRGGKYGKPQQEGSLPRALKGVLKKTEV